MFEKNFMEYYIILAIGPIYRGCRSRGRSYCVHWRILSKSKKFGVHSTETNQLRTPKLGVIAHTSQAVRALPTSGTTEGDI